VRVISQKAVLAVLFLFGSAVASAQIGGGTGRGGTLDRSPGFSAGVTFPGRPMPAVPVTGAPFSGVRESESTQTLADGTHISRKMMLQKIWRDSDGRMRTERPMMMALHASEDSPVIIEITDPIAGYRYTLDTQGKVAHRVAIAPPPAIPLQQRKAMADATARQGTSQPAPRGGLVGSFSTIPRRIVSQSESLGTKLIDGIPVQGTKWTHTIPAGEQGNDRPISTVTESWTSPDLKEMIESSSSDPRNGESVTRLTNIDRNNPDPSLFQVPADYEIVDEQGPFSINYHR
jgi:hypothetical protein